MGLSSILKVPGSAEKEKHSPPKDERAPEGANSNDEEVLDDEPKNMLIHLAGQLRVGMDLSKITLPVFVLEPRSMLERVTDFHSHPEALHGASAVDSAEERFIRVLKYYLGGWHIKPKGVKKPYNPILGEFFRCRYDYPDGTVAYYVAEQVSHHPPISAWYFTSPENGLDINGELRPKSKFLGNSAATIMEGASHVRLLDRPDDGDYYIGMPNMYARGILFGKMILELGDNCTVKNDSTGVSCELEFKTKGFFSGSYNAIGGKIKGPNGEVGDISGHWHEEMDITRKGSTSKEVLFDPKDAPITPKVVAPEDKQAWNESRRLWSKVTSSIQKKDLDGATEAKTAIEDAQRNAAHEREEKNEHFTPRFFELVDGEYKPKFSLPQDRAEAVPALRKFIYGDDFEPEPTVQKATQ